MEQLPLPSVDVPRWRDLPLPRVRNTFPVRDKRRPLDDLARERVNALICAIEVARTQLAALTAQLEDALAEIGRD